MLIKSATTCKVKHDTHYTYTQWQCSKQQGDKPVLKLSAKINADAGEILAP